MEASRSLQTSDLVHEAYLKLLGNQQLSLNDRRHFYAVAARAMRFILVDRARRSRAARHGGDKEHVPLDESIQLAKGTDVDLVALDDALEGLRSLDSRKHDAIELAYFGGLTNAEVSEFLEISPRTVQRELKTARIWLLHELRA